MSLSTKEIKLRIIAAGHKAVEQLIKVAEESIIKPNTEDELAADRLKNAAMTKKLAIFDAFEILNRIEAERETLDVMERGASKTDTKQGFAERRSKQ
jgi:predicted outer membrane protein